MRTALVLALALGAVTQELPAQVPAALKVTAQARAIQPGELVLLTVVTAAPAAAVQVRAFDRDVAAYQVDSGTWRALVGIDLDVKPGRHDVSISSGSAGSAGSAGPSERDRAVHRLIVLPKKFTTRTLTVDPAFVNPPPEAVSRIQADNERLSATWANSSAARQWTGPFVRPVGDPANSAFGSRSVFNGEPRNPHGGADFSSVAGTPVRAPNAGRVALASDLYFTGNTVIIDHGLGLFSLFAHLQSIDVREGDTVVAGQFVGNVGATGRVTGAHLHWTVRLNGARVDPLSLLAMLGK